MLSLYNSLGLDGGSGANGNRLLVVGNDIRKSFPEYSTRTPFRAGVDIDPNEQELDQSRSDINQDGIVDAGDLTILLSNFNLTVENANNERADINEDGIVDAADLTLILSNWGGEFDVPDDDTEEDGSGGNPPIVGVIETPLGLVPPTNRVDVKSSSAIPQWLRRREKNG